jgi:hypothetical protein
MKRLPLFLVILAVTVMCLTLTGCPDPGKVAGLNGEANIHADTMKPMVALVWLNSSNDLITDTACSLARSSSSWQDKPFICPWPSTTRNVWGIVAYNDKDGNGRYSDPEFLGYSTTFMRKLGAKFVLVTTSGTIINYDATTATGSEVYIDCEFTRSEPQTAAKFIEEFGAINKALNK